MRASQRTGARDVRLGFKMNSGMEPPLGKPPRSYDLSGPPPRPGGESPFAPPPHGDHIGRHDRTIATAATLALMRHRLGEPKRRKTEGLPAPVREPLGLGGLPPQRLPAG